jgi:hypothetical protein
MRGLGPRRLVGPGRPDGLTDFQETHPVIKDRPTTLTWIRVVFITGNSRTQTPNTLLLVIYLEAAPWPLCFPTVGRDFRAQARSLPKLDEEDCRII